MQNLAIKYGLMASAIMGIGGMIPIWIGDDQFHSEYGEVAGYLAIILALSAIFFGIKSYKDKSGKTLTFKRAFVFGLFVDLIAALVFGIFSFILYQWVMPDFLQAYFDQSIEQVKSNPDLSNTQITIQISDILKNKNLMLSPAFGGLLMFITVFPIGLVVTLISSFVLREKT